jgi:hypothetical protein
MDGILNTNSKTARLATSLFFFLCVPMSLWEQNVQSKIFVAQDPVATANNLLSNEFIFRTSIVSHITGTIIFVLVVLLFYRLLNHVDRHLSRLMVVSIIAQIAIVFVFEAINFTALMTLKSEARSSFNVIQQQEVAYFLLRLYRYGFGADKIIFGLFFIPLGILVFRSGYAPRVIGILMIIGGVGYLVDTSLYILLQRADYLVVKSLKLYSSGFYSIGLLWFLIKGVRNTNVVTT